MNRFFLLLFFALFSLPCLAEELPALENVEAQISALKESDLDAAQRDANISLLEELREILGNLSQLAKNKAQYQLDASGAPGALETVNNDLTTAPKEEVEIETSTLETREIEQKVAELQAQEASAQSKVAELASNLKQREQRLAELPKQLATAQSELRDFLLPPKPLSSADQTEQISYQVQLAKQQSLKEQIDELVAEQQFLNATEELFQAQTELAKKALANLSDSLKNWQTALEQKQSEASRLAKIETQNQAKRFQHIPLLSQITSENASLAQLSTRIVNLSAETNAKQEVITKQREETQTQRQNAQERLELLESAKMRIDTATGALLRKQRAQLPTTRSLQENLKENIRALTEAQVDLLEINKRRSELPDNNVKEATEIYERLQPEGVTREEITALLKQRRDLLLKVGADYQRYTAALQEYNHATRLTLDEVQTYSHYLDERLLWIPSAGRIAINDIETETTTVLGYFERNTTPWLQSLAADLKENFFLWLIYFLIAALLFWLRNRSHKRMAEIHATVSSRHCTSIVPTVQALRHTLTISVFIPFLLFFLAWRSQNFEAISHGLLTTAMFILLTGTLWHLSNSTGILAAHFGMNVRKMAHFHYHLTWFSPIMSALIFLTFALPKMQGPPEVGRLSFIVSMILLGTFSHLLFRPSKNLVESKGRLGWCSKFVHMISVGIPLIYIIGASLGYITSIYTLRGKLATSIWLGLLIVFIMNFLFRWILVSRRRFAREQAVKKYEAIIAKRNSAKTKNKTEAPTFEELEANAINPVKIEEQTTRLVRVFALVIAAIGLWGIWSTTLPALSFLDKVTIWGEGQSEQSESEIKKPADIRDALTGKSAASESDSTANDTQNRNAATENTPAKKTGISLQDLLVTFFIIALTISAAGNLPGLFELSLLRKIDLGPGSNYAITTVLRYLIIVIGLVIAFGHVGITWSSVQWLAAAVTLGIGFGLQEIFANFVAGIILLFERPIRLGDLVTVGEVSGKVTQIQIRATTILQFNNRELLVPNKEFITGQLVNWTLHDSILRFELPVGIAYGSDTAKATAIMCDLIAKHPNILETPAPDVLFSSFGPSTLDFIIRAFVASPDFLVSTQSELHYQIDSAFREAEIDIAIPQQDIYIKSLPPEFKNSAFSNKSVEE